jgi:hypothetical protein
VEEGGAYHDDLRGFSSDLRSLCVVDGRVRLR